MATPAYFLGPFAWKVFFPTFDSEVVSVFVSEMSFLYAAECWILCIQSDSLCLFIVELSPFLLTDTKE